MHRAPLRVWFIALMAVAIHLFPVLTAQFAPRPSGWEFTGNATVSPDMMQYRVWTRQTATEGPLVSNRLTTEPNKPHLFVALYWVIGRASAATGISPEWMYHLLGVPLTIVLVLLLYSAIRYYGTNDRWDTWILVGLVFGGGLGAHLKLLNAAPILKDTFLIRKVVGEGLAAHPAVFENYRSHYIIKTLQDTHFLLIWIVTLACVLAFVDSCRRGGTWRYLLSGFLAAASTFLHVYEGVTLAAIALGISVAVWSFADRRPFIVRSLVAVAVAIAISYAILGWWVANAGIPMSTWRAVPVLFTTLLIAYPVAWALMAWGLGRYWKDGGFAGRAIVGWIAGCTFVTLSAPFYAYPDRGTMTMQFPLMVMAGGIYFAFISPVLTRRALLISVLLMGATPAWLLAVNWTSNTFKPTTPYRFTSSGHREIIAALGKAATPDDVLLVDGADALWLAPEFPGRLYVGHFFLTVDYDRKASELDAYLTRGVADPAWLQQTGARWLYVGASREPRRFAADASLRAVAQTDAGTLFEVLRVDAR